LISDLDAHRAIHAASRACAARLANNDGTYPEHRLQSFLTATRLGLKPSLVREFPALRPPGGRALIDFCGVDNRKRLHVVETKVGHDTMLALQGLDYWIWATANLDLLADHFNIEKLTGVVIDFVTAAKPGAARKSANGIGPYTPGQLEALSGAVTWKIWDVPASWTTGAFDLIPHITRRVPPVPRVTPPAWSPRLNAHLRASAPSLNAFPVTLSAHGQYWSHPILGLTNDAQLAYDLIEARGKVHKDLANVRSSQAFALNMLASLDESGRVALARNAGLDVVAVAEPEWEYNDELDRLGEATPSSAHTTQVDALFVGTNAAGQRHLLLIEVKLSEPDFSGCSAWEAKGNDRLDLCAQPHPFGGEPAGCFQLRNKGHGLPRLYDKALIPLSEKPSGVGCWFRASGNQPMRNLALARTLLSSGEAARAVVALCAPAKHQRIWRRWDETTKRLKNKGPVTFANIRAEEVLVHLPIDIAEKLAGHYLLAITAAHQNQELIAWKALLAERFPSGVLVRRTTKTNGPENILETREPVTAELDWDGSLLAVVLASDASTIWAGPINDATLDGHG
jgi:hypothetical protein